jgi:haloalkane dehalogenase
MNGRGGPIGLDFAHRHPERVKRLVIANTWCWPVGDDFHFKSFSFLMSSWTGQYLPRQHNILVNGVMPRAVGDRSVLTPKVMAHYRGAQPSPAARAASAALPGYIVGASDWLCGPNRRASSFPGSPCASRSLVRFPPVTRSA